MEIEPDHATVVRRRQVAANLAEYGPDGDCLRWASSGQARAAEARRARLLAAMAPALTLAHGATKPHVGPLSPGCTICGDGDWSCLFINGLCRCRCFYCPTSQNAIGVPTTNRVPFSTPADYADYVNRMGFRGVSLSGGEPFLTAGRSLAYLREVRYRCRPDLYIWMYTSGAPLSPGHLLELKALGLDELRIDISAVAYDLKKVAMAVSMIPRVSVEIPAIPEDAHRLSALLPALADMGVAHLNVHQLRLTPSNRAALSARDYTFLHGDRVTVLESELAALALLQDRLQTGSRLPVNYCSYAYKHRYQGAATRRRNARWVCKPYESITENGFIRMISLVGSPDAVQTAITRWEGLGVDARYWHRSSDHRLAIHPDLWFQADLAMFECRVAYAEARMSPHVTYRHAFVALPINTSMTLYMERQRRQGEWVLDESAKDVFAAMFLVMPGQRNASATSLPDDLIAAERIPAGLPDYF